MARGKMSNKTRLGGPMTQNMVHCIKTRSVGLIGPNNQSEYHQNQNQNQSSQAGKKTERRW